jgi:hypothetical protein
MIVIFFRGISKPDITVNHFSPRSSKAVPGLTDGRGSVKPVEDPLPEPPVPKFERILDDILVCHASPLGNLYDFMLNKKENKKE